ncbi:hypothetical protein [Brevibacillus reuszeri]|uniref:hypothetical protein n=1 Tax=Brevibacillus reuszeri TaxID=54915 RepID=UPI000CCC2281|nr:hypothetical protein [Brevibacillus reuszeri]
MKKIFLSSILALTAIFPISALAAPANVNTTSNFTITVVEETLGLTISGETHIDAIENRNAPGSYYFDIKNSGNTPGVLYSTALTPTGIDWSSITWYQFSWSGDKTSPFDVLRAVDEETKLRWLMEYGNNIGSPNSIEPAEVLKTNFLIFKKGGYAPGEYSFPIRFTIKAN